jgi:hypothetical protein
MLAVKKDSRISGKRLNTVYFTVLFQYPLCQELYGSTLQVRIAEELTPEGGQCQAAVWKTHFQQRSAAAFDYIRYNTCIAVTTYYPEAFQVFHVVFTASQGSRIFTVRHQLSACQNGGGFRCVYAGKLYRQTATGSRPVLYGILPLLTVMPHCCCDKPLYMGILAGQ